MRDASGISIIGKWGRGGMYVPPPPAGRRLQVTLCFCEREFTFPQEAGVEVSCPHCGRAYKVHRGSTAGSFYVERLQQG